MSQRKASCPKARAGSWLRRKINGAGCVERGVGGGWGPWSTHRRSRAAPGHHQPPLTSLLASLILHQGPGTTFVGAMLVPTSCAAPASEWETPEGLRGQTCRHSRDPHQGPSWSNPRRPLMAQQDCLYGGHPPYISHYNISVAPHPKQRSVPDT